MFQPLNMNHVTQLVFMCHSVPAFLCAPYNPLYYSIRQRNATLHVASPTRAYTQTRHFRVENVFNAYINLEQTLPIAVHHIPSVNPPQKVTPCCYNFVVTYREREHCLSPVLFYALQFTKHGGRHPTLIHDHVDFRPPTFTNVRSPPLKLGRS